MSVHFPSRRRTLGYFAALFPAGFFTQAEASEPWTDADLISPTDLAARLADPKSAPPLLLHVGFPVLYKGAHLPHSVYAGPGAKPAGLEELRKAVRDVAHDRETVVYCGCCPWAQCPNIRPAYTALREIGFTRLKVLTIPTNLHTDWVTKGYPVERG